MIVGPHSTKLPQSWDTGSDQPAILISVLQFLTDGIGLSLEPAWRSCGLFSCFTGLFAIYMSLLTIEGKGQLPIHFILRWLWQWLFSLFSGPFTDPFVSGVTELFLHVRCSPQQNSQ